MSGPPRPIKGSVGSRVRLIFGESGQEWLLLLNHDDGNMEWQTQHWKNIPNAVAKQINNCLNKDRYIKEVDFGLDGEWYIHGIKRDGSAGHSWWGGTGTGASSTIKSVVNSSTDRIQVYFGLQYLYGPETYLVLQDQNGYWQSSNLNNKLQKRLKTINHQRKEVKFVRLFHNDSYYIRDDNGSQWLLKGGTHCSKILSDGGASEEEVAFARDGSWCIVQPNTFVSSFGVDNEMGKHLTNFFRDQKDRKRKREQEISDYHTRIRIEREEREAQEREARERAEREERERAQREERERLERAAAEARRRQAEEDRRIAEELAKKEFERQETASLETLLTKQFVEEMENIKEVETQLKKRKRALQVSLDNMPPKVRAKIESDWKSIDTSPKNQSTGITDCVVCQCAPPTRAVVPCGHYCLCDECSGALTSGPMEARLCPLCRGRLESTLKIYSSHK